MGTELQYGRNETYKHELDRERLNWLTNRTNRSKGQTQFLFQLVDGDFEKLKQLEMQLRNCFCYYCPADKNEVEKVMNTKPKSSYFNL